MDTVDIITKIELLEQRVEFLLEENKKLWNERKFLYIEINTLNDIIDCYTEGFGKILEENKQLIRELGKEIRKNVL